MPLGCGVNTVILAERGGVKKLAEWEYESCSYGRVLSDQSSAEVRIPSCEGVTPRAWEHELAVYRDSLPVWAGPVTELTVTDSGMTVKARDLFAWMERRLPPRDRFFVGLDCSTMFRILVEDALSRDPSPNLLLSVSLSGVIGDRTVLQATRRRIADELRELARTAVDWTMVGRVLHASKPPVRWLLQDEHINEPKLEDRGLDIASEVTVIGNAASGVVFTATSPMFRTGLLETVASEPQILDNASAAANARGRLELLRDGLLNLEVRLTPDAPVTMDRLVPGALVAVSVTVGAMPLVQTLRLLSVQVTDGVEGERVTVTLTSAGQERT